MPQSADSARPGGVSRYMHIPFAEVASASVAAAVAQAEELAEEASLALLRELTARRPDAAEAWFALGGASDTFGREHDALPAYEEALRLAPDAAFSRYLHLQLGSTYRNCGRLEDAERLLSQGALRFPDFQVLRVMRAFVLHDLGRHAEAVRTLATLLSEAAPAAVAPYGRAIGFYAEEL